LHFYPLTNLLLKITICSKAVTDFRRGQIDHGLETRVLSAPCNSLLWRLIIYLKFAKLRRGITSQFTLKRAKMQTSMLLSVLQPSLPVTSHLYTENKPAEKTSNPRQLQQGFQSSQLIILVSWLDWKLLSWDTNLKSPQWKCHQTSTEVTRQLAKIR